MLEYMVSPVSFNDFWEKKVFYDGNRLISTGAGCFPISISGLRPYEDEYSRPNYRYDIPNR